MTNETDIFKTLSVVFGLLDVLSAALITDFCMRYKKYLNINFWVRFMLMMLATGLLLHAAEQVKLMQDYRLPRSISWIWIYSSLHMLVLLVWARAHKSHSEGMQA